jgi:hypothetical protein
LIDVGFETRSDVDPAACLAMIDAKTAADPATQAGMALRSLLIDPRNLPSSKVLPPDLLDEYPISASAGKVWPITLSLALARTGVMLSQAARAMQSDPAASARAIVDLAG